MTSICTYLTSDLFPENGLFLQDFGVANKYISRAGADIGKSWSGRSEIYLKLLPQEQHGADI